jgi:hypothetical protein
MKNILKAQFAFSLVVLIVLCCPVMVFAQPGFNNNVYDGAPIDGGLSLLAVAGAMYGVKKVFKPKSNSENVD